jgi:hypothetical protein
VLIELKKNGGTAAVWDNRLLQEDESDELLS